MKLTLDETDIGQLSQTMQGGVGPLTTTIPIDVSDIVFANNISIKHNDDTGLDT